jgi:hypothetical protein
MHNLRLVINVGEDSKLAHAQLPNRNCMLKCGYQRSKALAAARGSRWLMAKLLLDLVHDPPLIKQSKPLDFVGRRLVDDDFKLHPEGSAATFTPYILTQPATRGISPRVLNPRAWIA